MTQRVIAIQFVCFSAVRSTGPLAPQALGPGPLITWLKGVFLLPRFSIIYCQYLRHFHLWSIALSATHVSGDGQVLDQGGVVHDINDVNPLLWDYCYCTLLAYSIYLWNTVWLFLFATFQDDITQIIVEILIFGEKFLKDITDTLHDMKLLRLFNKNLIHLSY